MSAAQIADICPVIAKLMREENDLGMAKHMTQLCFHCLRKRLIDRFDRKKFLYEDKPPPWTGPSVVSGEVDGDVTPEEPAAKRKSLKIRKRKQDIKTVIPTDQVDEHLYKRSFELSDAQLKYEIVKMKSLSKEAAHAFMVELRRRARLEKDGSSGKTDEAEKTIIDRQFMPWCPRLQSLFPRGFSSVLSQREQIRFLGICQNISNGGTLRFAHNLKELKEFQKKVLREREHMETLVLDMIENNLECDDTISKNHPLISTSGPAPKFILERWNKRWNDEISQYKFDLTNMTSVDWKTRNIRRDAEIRPRLVTTLLKGRRDKLKFPNLHVRCILDGSRLHREFPISQCNEDRIFNDVETVTSLCLENDVRIAMDGTTACHLMSDPFIGHNYSYAIPIRVIQNVVKGTLSNIAILAKPRVLDSVDYATIQRQYIKYLLKTTYIHESEIAGKSNVGDKSPLGKPDSEAKSEFCDPLSTILSSLDRQSREDKKSVTNQSGNRKSYAVFSIVGSNILVRSRPPPLCTEGRQSVKGLPVSFQPRVEYVPNAGAMRLSEAESLWNYCKGIFKQSAFHALFRTHYSANHLLQLQCWETQDLNIHSGSERVWTGPSPKQDTTEMISSATIRFSRILDVISRLSHGNYMLVNKNDDSLQILSQVADQNHSSDVLECCKAKVSISKLSVQFRDAFNGLESIIPLQWQVLQGRAPGCYVAPDSKLNSLAQAPLPFINNTENGKKNKKKRTRNHRRREMLRRRKLLQLPGSSDVPVANPEHEEPTTYCPFGISAEPNSPSHCNSPVSPLTSPDRLVIDISD